LTNKKFFQEQNAEVYPEVQTKITNCLFFLTHLLIIFVDIYYRTLNK